MSVKVFPPPRGFQDPRAMAGMPADTRVAVGFSGGADSVALLAMLADTPVHAVHVHHGIRGAEADRDAAFCADLAAKLGVPFTLLRVDVPQLAAKSGQGLETAARNARYEAFADFMKKEGIPLLVTAHHAGDQLETMLQNLLRGSGTRGLCGIPALRALGNGLFVARPLLGIEKKYLLAYLAARGLDHVTDSTNAAPCCRRNILRGQVLPLLEELQPGAAAAAARCAAALAADEAYLDGLAADFLEKEGDAPRLFALSALPAPVFARVMRRLLPTVPTAAHIQALRELVTKATPHATLSLTGVRVGVENSRLVRLGVDVPVFDYCEPLTFGENVIDGVGVILLSKKEQDGTPLPFVPRAGYAHALRMELDTSIINGRLFARCRRPGDRILQGGMHKAVRRLRELSHLTPATRQRMPLICDDSGILAVPYGPVRDPKPGKTDTVIDLFFH